MPAHTTTPSHHRAHVHKVDISKRLAHGTVYMHLPSARRSDSSPKRTLLQSARHHQRSAFAHSVTIISCCQIKTVVKTTSKQINFPEIFSSSLKSLVLQPAVASAGQVAVSDSRWRMWRSWPGEVTNGLQLYCKTLGKYIEQILQYWNEDSSQAQQVWWTFLQPACRLPTLFKAWNICGSVIKLYIFWVAFKCDQSTAHMLNNHDVQSASW